MILKNLRNVFLQSIVDETTRRTDGSSPFPLQWSGRRGRISTKKRDERAFRTPFFFTWPENRGKKYEGWHDSKNNRNGCLQAVYKHYKFRYGMCLNEQKTVAVGILNPFFPPNVRQWKSKMEGVARFEEKSERRPTGDIYAVFFLGRRGQLSKTRS